MKITVRDIAKAAGVSPATVSNALNGRPGVSSDVEMKIRMLARQMGYIFSSPEANRQRFVRLVYVRVHGQVVMDTQFFGELIESIQRRCLEERLELTISHIDMSRDENWRKQVQGFCREECAGIIVLATEMNAEELAVFSQCQSPLIVLDNACRHMHFHSLVMDNIEAGHMATAALYRAGHRQIGHITSSIRFSNMTLRGYGYRNAMMEQQNESNIDEWAVRPTIEYAYEDMKKHLESGRPLPTAFFAGNDIIAIGAMRALKERGIDVPGQISIIGMDDTDLCLVCEPQLSTIRVFRKEMGRSAVEMLLSVVPNMASGRISATISVELVQRKSVKVLP